MVCEQSEPGDKRLTFDDDSDGSSEAIDINKITTHQTQSLESEEHKLTTEFLTEEEVPDEGVHHIK